MTRLIDANKLKMYFDTCQFCEKCPDIAFMCQRSCEFPNILTPQWERAIDEQPTVDAVPVEYILKQIVKLERSKGQSYHAICYRHLIEVWQMENERKEE